MNYVGVDVHKKYSVLCALDAGVLDAFGNTWYIATHIRDVHP